MSPVGIRMSSVALQCQVERAHSRCTSIQSESSRKKTALKADKNRIRGLEEQLEDCRVRTFQSLPNDEI